MLTQLSGQSTEHPSVCTNRPHLIKLERLVLCFSRLFEYNLVSSDSLIRTHARESFAELFDKVWQFSVIGLLHTARQSAFRVKVASA